MDPNQRVFLETAWEALENSGHDPRRYPGAIGVFAGSGGSVSSYLFALAERFQAYVSARQAYLTSERTRTFCPLGSATNFSSADRR